MGATELSKNQREWDALKLVKELSNRPIVQSEISLQLQMGLPIMKEMGGELCICFKPHREDYRDGKILYYPAQYEIAWVYPFHHVVSFRNLHYTDGCNAAQPLCEMTSKWMLKIGAADTEALYEFCSKVLNSREKCGKINHARLREYQAALKETVRNLGLEALYCDER